MHEDQRDWAEHLMRVERYSRMVEDIFRTAVREFIRLGYSVSDQFDPEKGPFEFSNFPALTVRVERILRSMHKELTAVIARGVEREWLAANAKNDRLIDRILKTYNADREVFERLKHRNLEALHAFQNRKINGLKLSEKVWNYTKTFENEMSMIVDVGLSEGKTATKIAQEAQPLLNEPNNLFRRVRDKHGILRPSKAMKAKQTQPGVYKSSFKNAHRMSRTEINMAYRMADHERRMSNPLIVGYEVRRSNNPYPCPRCDAMKGRYPKSYVFRSNHPQCRCYAVTILATPEEIDAWIEAGAEGAVSSVNEVKEMPAEWKAYVKENTDRLMSARRIDYWIQDNFKGGDIRKGLKIDLPI